MDESIFKKYDIRGVYPEQINEQAVYKICFGFLEFVKDFYNLENPKIVIGYDIRESSPALKQAGINALIDGGAEVIDIGLCSTPLNYFANWSLKADASIMITASHNPKQYNGIKFSLKDVVGPVEIGVMDRIKELALKGDFQKNGAGKLVQQDMLNEYISFLKEKLNGVDLSNFKIAVDCGNGMIGPEFQRFANELGFEYKGLFMEPDSSFPNHEPNPLDKEAIKPLQELMSEEKFDLGVIFDGDGDRLGVLNSRGELIKNDFLIGVFAQYFAMGLKNKKIVSDARLSRGVKEQIEKLGGEVLKSPVGYPNVRQRMRKDGCFFGGELSGHFFWQDFSYVESALLSLVRLLKILKQVEYSLEELIKPFSRYFGSGEINFEIENKEEKIREIEKNYQDGKISHLDGLTVEYPDWWFNLRMSGTEPLIRLTVEANTKELFNEKIKELTKIINEAGPR
ncbi:phosphomannomutase/phosphoglucomutase [Patescibacteria group bacterium]|nr:phosphomannomutase/phosphoglucomutase [Patescibacteria group bacterium]MBU4022979.1 phosphomannomutase/phosphoglucomutase [Patescibacteria group bacterium]MBU4078551.1 phosphomannomutase/phosphoglucomutase [Patescibacteria group bacterium]